MAESWQENRGLRLLWMVLAGVVIVSFGALLYYGREVYQMAPPVPERILTPGGTVVFTGDDIRAGQDVWRSIGGHELGSIWGHGSYTAPDWTADWLHREAVWLLDHWAHAERGRGYEDLEEEHQAALRARLQHEMRTNTYDPVAETITVSELRVKAIHDVQAHYLGLFGLDPQYDVLRESYAMPAGTVATPEHARQLTAFFFWATWACVTERPGEVITYTNNWPPERLVGNVPTGVMIVVSVASFVLLLGGIGGLAWFYAATREFWRNMHDRPSSDPLRGLTPTPSMYATQKYFWIVGALLIVQMLMGIVTAHYGVEGTGFYGIPLADWLPYSLARTWHVQLGILWIATSWLATGLCLAPAIAGREPGRQRLGVNVLFVALVFVVAGSMAGQALAIHHQLEGGTNFWFGHQGFEYIELGTLLADSAACRALSLGESDAPCVVAGAAYRPVEQTSSCSVIFILSVISIALFYSAGLMWERHTNLAIAEYWRWWVVHLWVEGFFEVFAVTVIAFAFTRLGLVRVRSATMADIIHHDSVSDRWRPRDVSSSLLHRDNAHHSGPGWDVQRPGTHAAGSHRL